MKKLSPNRISIVPVSIVSAGGRGIHGRSQFLACPIVALLQPVSKNKERKKQ